METVRIHRVGTLTTGIALVAYGILFILHIFMNYISYDFIFKLWPIILIGLGVEVLLSSIFKDKIVYDKGAVALMFFMAIFAMGMACADLFFEYFQAAKLF